MHCRRIAIELVVLLSSTLTFGQFRTVTVQNANNNPVPTTVTNTPTVNVSGTVPVTLSGTPSVNATITGTADVSATITGTPNVAVTSPVGTAGAANTAGLLVKSLDDPARQPFQRLFGCNTPCAAQTFIVPSSKTLVIDYVSFHSSANSSGESQLMIDTVAGGTEALYFFSGGDPSFFAPCNASAMPCYPPGRQNTNVDRQVTIYADPGSPVTLSAGGTAGWVLIFSVSGHLVNVP
jgi:hypothetical protein